MVAPALLNDDGTASIATALMLSHHGLRRDLACLATALGEPLVDRVDALRDAWRRYRETLHGHHESEDQGVLAGLAHHPTLKEVAAKLSADHRRIDPLLDRGDAAFAALPDVAGARLVVGELKALLDPHLAIEEAEIVPLLRSTKTFPSPPNDEAAAMYAQGFAWCMLGVAEDVIERMCEMLPPAVVSKLAAERVSVAARAAQAFGRAPTGAARTPIPDGYA